MIMSEGLMQYTCLDSMRTRIEELWPELKEKLVQVLNRIGYFIIEYSRTVIRF